MKTLTHSSTAALANLVSPPYAASSSRNKWAFTVKTDANLE